MLYTTRVFLILTTHWNYQGLQKITHLCTKYNAIPCLVGKYRGKTEGNNRENMYSFFLLPLARSPFSYSLLPLFPSPTYGCVL